MDKSRTIQKAKQNTAPIASFFEKAKNVESDAENNPPAPTPFVADEAQSSTSNQDAVSVSFEFEKNVDNFNDDQLGLFDLSNEFPTDRGHFPSSMEDGDLKRLILNHGPCRPDGQFTVENAEGNITKNFCSSYYQLHTKTKLAQDHGFAIHKY